MASVLPITSALTPQAPAVADSVETPATTAATTTSPLAGITNQPLSVVFNALASAGVDTAINQEILTPTTGQTTGSFSLFIEQLFTALAAQSASAEQSAENAAAQQAPSGSQQTAAAAAATSASTANASTTGQSAAPNSALETDVQNLAQSVNAQANESTLPATEADRTDNPSLSPLQQSFDQFVSGVGGTSNSASLGGFLQALASNLHSAQSPRGNIVDLRS